MNKEQQSREDKIKGEKSGGEKSRDTYRVTYRPKKRRESRPKYCSAVQYSTVQYSTVQRSAIQCSTVNVLCYFTWAGQSTPATHRTNTPPPSLSVGPPHEGHSRGS